MTFQPGARYFERKLDELKEEWAKEERFKLPPPPFESIQAATVQEYWRFMDAWFQHCRDVMQDAIDSVRESA